MDVEYGGGARLALLAVAVAGFSGLNGAFLYGLLMEPGALDEALSNPVSAAFMIEALLLVPVLAYLLAKWRVARLGWGWFVVLSLVGGLAFALPVVLLWPRPERRVEDGSP